MNGPPNGPPSLSEIVRLVLTERWVPLPVGPGEEFEGVAPIYWVSTEGRVLAICPRARCGTRVVLKSVRPEIRRRRRPHARVNLKLPGRKRFRTVRLHRLVLAAFRLRPEPEGKLGLHKNGDPRDNRLENLRYGSYGENLADQYAHGARESLGGREGTRGIWGQPCPGCGTFCPWCSGEAA